MVILFFRLTESILYGSKRYGNLCIVILLYVFFNVISRLRHKVIIGHSFKHNKYQLNLLMSRIIATINYTSAHQNVKLLFEQALSNNGLYFYLCIGIYVTVHGLQLSVHG